MNNREGDIFSREKKREEENEESSLNRPSRTLL
jgi:hypothetical protein